MSNVFLHVAWILLPAGVANSVPVIAARYNILSALAIPIDGGSGLLGDNKTVRGFALGVIFGSITGFLQYILLGLEPFTQALSAAILGGLLGLGALLGDALKSFVKRRLRIAPGKPWRPFDQVDATIGALIVASLFIPLTFQHIATAIILFGIISWVTSVVGFWLHIKKSV